MKPLAINSALALSPLMLLPLWLYEYGNTYLLQFAWILFFVPVITTLANISLFREGYIRRPFVATAIVMVVAPIVGYLNWGVSTNMLLKPDTETLAVLNGEIVFGLVLAAVTHRLKTHGLQQDEI